MEWVGKKRERNGTHQCKFLDPPLHGCILTEYIYSSLRETQSTTTEHSLPATMASHSVTCHYALTAAKQANTHTHRYPLTNEPQNSWLTSMAILAARK